MLRLVMLRFIRRGASKTSPNGLLVRPHRNQYNSHSSFISYDRVVVIDEFFSFKILVFISSKAITSRYILRRQIAQASLLIFSASNMCINCVNERLNLNKSVRIKSLQVFYEIYLRQNILIEI